MWSTSVVLKRWSMEQSCLPHRTLQMSGNLAVGEQWQLTLSPLPTAKFLCSEARWRGSTCWIGPVHRDKVCGAEARDGAEAGMTSLIQWVRPGYTLDYAHTLTLGLSPWTNSTYWILPADQVSTTHLAHSPECLGTTGLYCPPWKYVYTTIDNQPIEVTLVLMDLVFRPSVQ